MSANSGYIVETKKGNRGRTKNTDRPINGKQIIYLEYKDGTPVLENGQQKKILSNPEEMTVIGFVD